MGDKNNNQSGKPNKFNEQNKQAEERKAADNPRQGQPATEPRQQTTQDQTEAATNEGGK